MVHGMVNANAGYPQTTNAISGFSDLILELYGLRVARIVACATNALTRRHCGSLVCDSMRSLGQQPRPAVLPGELSK
jgi:hypothetical protein